VCLCVSRYLYVLHSLNHSFAILFVYVCVCVCVCVFFSLLLLCEGSMLGSVLYENTSAAEVKLEDPNTRNLVSEVSSLEPRFYGPEDADVTVVAVDCGMKLNQLRCLLKRGCRVQVVPWDYDFTKLEFDGLFLR
jgi:carbamoyl-phosphate synthase small subunit